MVGSDPQSSKLSLTFGLEVEVLYGMRCSAEAALPAGHWLRAPICPGEKEEDTNLNPELFECRGIDHVGLYRCRGCGPSKGLWQTAKILGRQGGEVLLQVDSKADNETFDKFSIWNLAPEIAVIPPRHGGEMNRWSNGALSRKEDPDDFDWTGVELISPALPVPDLTPGKFRLNGLTQVNGYLNMLQTPPGAPYIFIGHPRTSSVHCHIGIQPSPEGQTDLPLNILRHVAFMCVLFEDTITLLHHPHRHSYEHSKARDHAIPNRTILGTTQPQQAYHHCRLGEPFSPEETFMKIFNYQDRTEAGARQRLMDALTTKKSHGEQIFTSDLYRTLFVNFENLALDTGPDSKKTIEFRQHCGTLSAHEIDEWIIFVTAIVRTAERLAAQPGGNASVPPALASKIYGKYKHPFRQQAALAEAAKYAHILRTARRSLRQLFDLLELPIKRREYWWNRAKMFQDVLKREWKARGLPLSICSSVVLCTNPAVRDCEGWEEGELDCQPWDEEDEEDDEGVPMEIDDDVPEPGTFYQQSSADQHADEDDVPMETDDDQPEPETLCRHPTTQSEMTSSPIPSLIDDIGIDSDVSMDMSDDEVFDTPVTRQTRVVRSQSVMSISSIVHECECRHCQEEAVVGQ